jgi:mRNA interferase MazF
VYRSEIHKKSFPNWTEVKAIIDSMDTNPPIYRIGDVWWLSIGANVGYEEDGKGSKFLRPVLVLVKFNSQLFLGVPMSTQIKNNKYYIQVNLNSRVVSVLLSQIRAYSTRRFHDKLGKLNKQDFDLVVNMVIKMIISLL